MALSHSTIAKHPLRVDCCVCDWACGGRRVGAACSRMHTCHLYLLRCYVGAKGRTRLLRTWRAPWVTWSRTFSEAHRARATGRGKSRHRVDRSMRNSPYPRSLLTGAICCCGCEAISRSHESILAWTFGLACYKSKKLNYWTRFFMGDILGICQWHSYI